MRPFALITFLFAATAIGAPIAIAEGVDLIPVVNSVGGELSSGLSKRAIAQIQTGEQVEAQGAAIKREEAENKGDAGSLGDVVKGTLGKLVQ